MIGAGNAADKVLREIELHPELQVKVVGLVDDNPSKLGSVLRRKRVLGTSAELPLLIKRYQIQEVLITMPSASGDVIRRILSVLAPTQVRVKTLPGIWEMVEGIKGIETYRQVKLEDLLERSPIRTNVQEIGDYLRDQVILVTGAGGSIGSELVRQLVTFSPRQILLLGRGENRIFKIDYEVRNKLSYPHGIPLIINICDHERVNALLESYHPSIIFHCAAHKHVPLMELHPEEAIKNNVIATKHLLEGAIQTGVKRFINISTDKAVNPISVMGASKRIVELLISAYNQKNGMICTSVRFGNVLGSNSSVVELFSEQLQLNRTIKVTDERMERYFMLIPEAVELVLQAGALAQGSEIFVLNMGERVNIHEFAQSFIKLSGMELGKDAFIEIIGNRGNEKLSEDLWSSTETIHQTSNPWIFQIPCTVSIEKIESQIQSYPLFRSDASRLNTDDTRQELFKFLRQIENI